MKSFQNNNSTPALSPAEEKKLRRALKNLIGFKPHYLHFYTTALTHRSSNEFVTGNNERLEYLGDAFIGAIVGKYLFKKYPTEDEGYLTEMRSKIVSRKSLDQIGRRMGLPKLLDFNQSDVSLHRSHIFGNALEALVGAIYLDVGFKKTEKFFISHVIELYVDMDQLEQAEYNFKNKLYTWAQHQGKELDFVTLSEKRESGRKVFTIGVLADKEEIGKASGYSKKEASQAAAQEALSFLSADNKENVSE